MKTVYIPTGTEVSHMNLATGHLVVDGSLTITGTLKAQKRSRLRFFGGRWTVSSTVTSSMSLRATVSLGVTTRSAPRKQDTSMPSVI